MKLVYGDRSIDKMNTTNTAFSAIIGEFKRNVSLCELINSLHKLAATELAYVPSPANPTSSFGNYQITDAVKRRFLPI